MTDEEVHAAIVADPEARPTDEAFWGEAHVVVPPSSRPAATQRKKSANIKTREELQRDIDNYIAARKWYRERVEQGNATDEDLRRLERCRDLAVEARRAGVTTPAFE